MAPGAVAQFAPPLFGPVRNAFRYETSYKTIAILIHTWGLLCTNVEGAAQCPKVRCASKHYLKNDPAELPQKSPLCMQMYHKTRSKYEIYENIIHSLFIFFISHKRLPGSRQHLNNTKTAFIKLFYCIKLFL